MARRGTEPTVSSLSDTAGGIVQGRETVASVMTLFCKVPRMTMTSPVPVNSKSVCKSRVKLGV